MWGSTSRVSKLSLAAVISSAILLSGRSASADPLAPGTTINNPTVLTDTPDLGSHVIAGTLDGTDSGGYTLKDAGNVTQGTGTYTVKVYSDTNNIFSSGDITISVSVSVSTGDIGRLTLTNFGTFLTNIYDDQSAGQITDSSVSRSSDGAQVDIDFADKKVVAGQASDTFVIETNAPNFGTGTLNLIDSGVAAEFSFQPAGAAPLPATASMGLGLFGVIGAAGVLNSLRRRRVAAL